MKKIIVTILALSSLMVVADRAHSMGTIHVANNCELEVTGGEGSDPCVVINRVGFKNPCGRVGGEDVWIPEGNIDCDYDGGQDDETYFRDWDQYGVAEHCSLTDIANDVTARKSYCSVGKHDGYDTAVIGFQLEHVVTPKLHESPSSRNLVENNYGYIPSILNETIFLGGSKRQFILTDARFFWEGFDGHRECFGDIIDCRRNSKNTFWDAILVDDLISEYSDPEVAKSEQHPSFDYVPFFNPDNFGDHRRVTILDGREVPAVPIIVGADWSAETELGKRYDPAFFFHGPEESEKASRAVIRGWKVGLKAHSGKGLFQTQGDFDLVFARTRINVGYNPEEEDDRVQGKTTTAEWVFSLDGRTDLDFCGGDGCHGDEIGLEVNLGSRHKPVFLFRGVPNSWTLRNMAEGLKISYEFNPQVPNAQHPIPMRINGVDQTIKCTLVRNLGCEEEDGDDRKCLECAGDDLRKGETCISLPLVGEVCSKSYLVFTPTPTDDGNWEFDISLSKSPIPDDPASIVYVIDAVGDNSWWFANSEFRGARIVFDDSNLPEEEAALDFDRIHIGPREWDNVSDSIHWELRPTCGDNEHLNSQNRCVCDDGFRMANGVCTRIECDDGYTRNNDGVCTRIECDDDDVCGPDDCDGIYEHFDEDLDECVCDYGYSGNNGVCTKDADLTECAEGEILALGSCVPDFRNPDPNPAPADEDPAGIEGGCSLVASQSAGSWARFLLVIPALLGLCLFRSLRRRHRRRTRS